MTQKLSDVLKQIGNTKTRQAYKILCDKYGFKLTDILANAGCLNLTSKQVDDILRLATSEPVDYIIGKTQFYGLELAIQKPVLIPRADTEILVKAVIKDIQRQKTNKRLNLLELGSGSGAIIVSIMHYGDKKNISIKAKAVDRLQKAVQNTNLNAKMHNISDLSVMLQHFTIALQDIKNYDIIVSNPPYIKPSYKFIMQDSVKMHESHIALFAKQDGIAFYRQFFAAFASKCRKNAMIYLEIGFDIYTTLIQDLEKYRGRLRLQSVLKDDFGVNRVLVLKVL